MSDRHLHPDARARRPLPRMVLAQARMETRLLLRNGEQLLLAVVIPLLVLVGGITAAEHCLVTFRTAPIDVLAPGVLALAVMSTSFTVAGHRAPGSSAGTACSSGSASSPLPRSGLLAGQGRRAAGRRGRSSSC